MWPQDWVLTNGKCNLLGHFIKRNTEVPPVSFSLPLWLEGDKNVTHELELKLGATLRGTETG